MSVLFDSSSSGWIRASGTSGSVSLSHIVNTLANDLVAVVGVMFLGDDPSAGTISATFGGDAMTASDPVDWVRSDHLLYGRMIAFTLTDPGTGPQTIHASYSGMAGAYLQVVAATYSGVSTIGDLVTASDAGTAANAVTVTSVAPAYRVVTLHGFGGVGNANSFFTSYSLAQRAAATSNNGVNATGEILLGDSPGAASVTGTATQTISSDQGGAIGIPLSPSIVKGDATLNMSILQAGSGHLYRAATPSPLRTWVIES